MPLKFLPTLMQLSSFNAVEGAEALKKAMKGLGTDETAIIKVITSCPSAQRQQILLHYNNAYERDLIKDLKKELSGNFEDVVLAMMTPICDYLAKELHHAIKEKKGSVITEILCSYDNNVIRGIKEAYERVTDDKLEEDLEEKLSGTFEEVLVATARAQRGDTAEESESEDIAKKLYNNGDGLVEAEVVKALSTCSFEQLVNVFGEYYKLAGRTLGETFDLEYKGQEKSDMNALFQCLEKRSSFFAEALRRAMSGLGTNDRDLIRLLVSRSEVDLASIKDEYQSMYSRSLEEDVKSEASGDYKKVLLALVNPSYYH